VPRVLPIAHHRNPSFQIDILKLKLANLIKTHCRGNRKPYDPAKRNHLARIGLRIGDDAIEFVLCWPCRSAQAGATPFSPEARHPSA
jgi:hypothetical protein